MNKRILLSLLAIPMSASADWGHSAWPTSPEKALRATIYKAYASCIKEKHTSSICAVRADQAGRDFTLLTKRNQNGSI